MAAPRARSLTALALALAACADPPAPANITDGATPRDASAPDTTPLPPGDPGRILSVPLSPDEDWTLPGLAGPVHVIRTEAGIPHVYARTLRDATLVQGFLAARDRYTQIELARRLGLGQISALLGDRGLATDQGTRDRGYAYITDRLLAQLSPAEGELLDAYAQGINAYIEAVRARRLPVPTELGPVGILLGTTRPWELMRPMTRRDLCAVQAAVVFVSSFTANDLGRARAAALLPGLFRGAAAETLRREGARRDVLDRVAPLADVSSAPGFGLHAPSMSTRARPRRERAPARRAPSLGPELLARALAAAQDHERLLHGPPGAEYGSNVWATSARASARGATLLAGDGHLPLSIPTLLHQMGLDTTVFGDASTGVQRLGLFFPGIPAMALGTNGAVAYSFTYLYGDLTDWYAEELRLDAQGRPAASRYRGEWRPLVATEERAEVANVPGLGSMGRTETWTRWTTFDGRWLAALEGRPAPRGTTPGPGQSIVVVQGVPVIPGDTDGDGRVTAVSFDYAGFDVSDLTAALDDLARARTVADVRNAQRRFVGFAQNFVAADRHGSVYYSGYTATPCRSYLPRAGGAWESGADPRLLLDGQRHGGFTIPLDARGLPDESAGASDPQRCVVPFEQWPAALDPAAGYVLNANNDLGALGSDGNLANDRHYLGGPWDVGFRARTIRDALARHATARSATVDAMAALQADHRSPLAALLHPFLRDAIARGRALAAAGRDPEDPSDARLLAHYRGERDALDEADRRLAAWVARGANAASGVATFYDRPSDDDRADAAATMIWNAWLRELQGRVWDDEGLDAIFDAEGRSLRVVALATLLLGRGENNPGRLASWDPSTRESAFFDVLGTPAVERAQELAVQSLASALATLRAPPAAPGAGGFGSRDMSTWLWGLRHQVALPSIIEAYAAGVMGVELITAQLRIAPARLPLAPELAEGDPRRGLPWFPRPGDFFNVDAANPPVSGADYVYRNGPVMRMVIELGPDGVRGQNVLPGGQSGVASSPHFDDQARLWLGNRALPMRFDVAAVLAGATGREHYHP